MLKTHQKKLVIRRSLVVLLALAVVATLYAAWALHRANPSLGFNGFPRDFPYPDKLIIRAGITPILDHDSPVAYFSWDIVRYRLKCAMAAGISVATAMAGAIFLLMRQSQEGLCLRCGYDLRGTVSAGRTSCPECGHKVILPTM